MKTIISALILAISHTLCLASTTYNLRGTQFEADTLFHAAIGPGTTQTSLLLHNDANRELRVFYSTIDLTNPYVTLRCVSGQDKFSGTERVSSMAERKSAPGERYFLGINADFFLTAGYTGRGESLIGVPCGSIIADGKIFKAETNSYYTQFAFDGDKTPYIGSASFGGSVTDPAGEQVPLGGVNADAADNQIVFYNSYYFAGTNQWGDCAEAQVALAEGETFVMGRPFKVVVTSEPSTAQDMDIPQNGFVIHGQGHADMGGTTTIDFVKNLAVGDTLTVNLTVSLDGKEIVPTQIISGFPKSVSDGAVTETEWMLDEFSTNQPVTELGFANDGKTVIFIVIDGRSTLSSGCRTTEVADLLRQLGVTQAINFDSGGSTTFYTSALGIRNRPSDGSERADANGIFAVSIAPDDSVITQIQFVDWSVKVPKYGIYTPQFYGYNQYGMLIDTNLQGVTIECLEELGHIIDGTQFVGNGSGSGMLTATLGELTAQVPITIVGNETGIALLNDSIINDTFRQYAVQLVNTSEGTTRPVDPTALSWTSSDNNTVTINPSTGVLQGIGNGIAFVTGTLADTAFTMKVIVEKPNKRVMPIEPVFDPTTWAISQSGGKNASIETQGTSFSYTYTGASSRAPKIVLAKEVRLWSLPDTIRLRVNPGEVPFKSAVLSLKAGTNKTTYNTLTPDTVIADTPLTLNLPTDSWLDPSDMSNYPIILNSIQLNLGASTVGKQYTINFMGIETVYDNMPPIFPGDVNGDNAIDVKDVTALITYILGDTPPDFNAPNANLNDDNDIDVQDVTALINLILQ